MTNNLVKCVASPSDVSPLLRILPPVWARLPPAVFFLGRTAEPSSRFTPEIVVLLSLLDFINFFHFINHPYISNGRAISRLPLVLSSQPTFSLLEREGAP